MLLNLTDLSDEPLQGQISRQIRARILAGGLPAGETLPSIRALARAQQVSVITVQRAYEALEREGLIHSRRGKGFFISELRDQRRKDMAEQRLIQKMAPLVADARSEGLSKAEIKEVFETVMNVQIDK